MPSPTEPAVLRPTRSNFKLALFTLGIVVGLPILAYLVALVARTGWKASWDFASGAQVGVVAGAVAFLVASSIYSFLLELNYEVRFESAALRWPGRLLRPQRIARSDIKEVVLVSWTASNQTAINRAAPTVHQSAFVVATSGRVRLQLSSPAFAEDGIRTFCKQAGLPIRGGWDARPKRRQRDLDREEPELGAQVRRRGQATVGGLFAFLLGGLLLYPLIHLVRLLF